MNIIFIFVLTILVDMAFNLLQMFHVELGIPHRILNWTLYLNPRRGWVDSSNSVNYDQLKKLSYSKYSLLSLPVVGIETEKKQCNMSLGKKISDMLAEMGVSWVDRNLMFISNRNSFCIFRQWHIGKVDKAVG